MVMLQETGVAALSGTGIGGRHCLRAAICNHRTRDEDLDLLIAEMSRRGRCYRRHDGDAACAKLPRVGRNQRGIKAAGLERDPARSPVGSAPAGL